MTTSIGGLVIDLKAETAALRRDLAAARSQVNSFSRQLSGSFSQIETASRRLQRGIFDVSGALRGLATAFAGAFAGREVVGTIAGFEQAMANVRSVSRATAEDMRQLTAVAREMGAETVFSAREAAEGLGFLAMAGFNAQQAAAALPATLDLAAAGAIGLGEAADIASNVLSGFRLRAEDAGRVADVMAAGASSANTSVLQLGQALSYAAPIAASYGITVETATAAIGALSNAGIQADRAGTGLNRVLNELAAPGTKTVELMEELGVALEDIDPSQNALVDIIRRLDQAGIGAREFAGAVTEAFGERGAPALQAMLGQVDVLAALDAAYRDVTGRAEEMANIQSNTLIGAWRAFQSVTQELILQLGDDGLLGAMRGIVTFATDIVRVWAGMSDSVVNDLATVEFAARTLKFALIALGGAVVLNAIRALTLALLANPLTLWISAGAAALATIIDLFSRATAATVTAAEAMNGYGSTVEEVTAHVAELSAGQRELAQFQATQSFREGLVDLADKLRDVRGVLESGFIRSIAGLDFEEQARRLQAFREQMSSLLTTVLEGETPLADFALAFADAGELTESQRRSLIAMIGPTEDVIREIRELDAWLAVLSGTATEADYALLNIPHALQQISTTADTATDSVLGLSRAMAAFDLSRMGARSQSVGYLSTNPPDFFGMSGFTVTSTGRGGRGGGGGGGIDPQEQARQAFQETTARLDEQIAAAERLARAHQEGAAAVREAEIINRAYAEALRLGVAADQDSVAAIQDRIRVLSELNTEMENASLLHQARLDEQSAQDQYGLIGLSGLALDQAEARLRVIQDLRARGIGLESELAQQMIASAEATAYARGEAEFLANTVGAAYQGLGELATTAATNFENLGQTAGRVLLRIANMIAEFGFQQIFGYLFQAAGFAIGAGGGGGVSVGGLYHSGKAAGQIPALHDGFAGMTTGPNEFLAILQSSEEVLTTADPRHRRNQGRVGDTGGGSLPLNIYQTFHVSTGVTQTVRYELARMLPKIKQASVAAVQEATNRDPYLIGGGA